MTLLRPFSCRKEGESAVGVSGTHSKSKRGHYKHVAFVMNMTMNGTLNIQLLAKIKCSTTLFYYCVKFKNFVNIFIL